MKRQTSLKIPEDLYAMLRKAAEADGIDLTKEIIKRIECGYENCSVSKKDLLPILKEFSKVANELENNKRSEHKKLRRVCDKLWDLL